MRCTSDSLTDLPPATSSITVLSACWFTPVPGPDGHPLGTFAVYRRQPGWPADDELVHHETDGRFWVGVGVVMRDAAAAHLHRAQTREIEPRDGIQDITNAMVEDFKLSDVLRMILETMYRAMEFDRIIFCMRDAKTETMVGRFGLGEGVERYVKVFKTHLKAPTPDLFGVVSVKGADTMISDATEARIVHLLREVTNAGGAIIAMGFDGTAP